jgi:hypothetical protein
MYRYLLKKLGRIGGKNKDFRVAAEAAKPSKSALFTVLVNSIVSLRES